MGPEILNISCSTLVAWTRIILFAIVIYHSIRIGIVLIVKKAGKFVISKVFILLNISTCNKKY